MSEALTALEQFAQDLQQEVLVKAGPRNFLSVISAGIRS